MKRSYAWWLLGYPFYQILGTARHEWSHAAAAMMQGARITEVKLIPSIDPQLGLLMGYVRWTGGHTNWFPTAAPYFCDILTFALAVALLERFPRMPRWLWMNVLILGVLSPILNLLYNYKKIFVSRYGDMNVLLERFPHPSVHLPVLAAMAVMGAYLWAKFRKPA